MNYVKKGFEFIAISFEFNSLNGGIMLVYWEILYKKCNGWIRIVIGDNRGQIRVIAIESDTETWFDDIVFELMIIKNMWVW